MTLPNRTRLELSAALRLISEWRDPEITAAVLISRFGLNRHDIAGLKIALGERPRSSPIASTWRQNQSRRESRR